MEQKIYFTGGRRLWAFLIDIFLLAIAIHGVRFALGLPLQVDGAYLLTMLCVAVAYFTLWEKLAGWTCGKGLMRLRVVAVEGLGTLTWRQALFRASLVALAGVGLVQSFPVAPLEAIDLTAYGFSGQLIQFFAMATRYWLVLEFLFVFFYPNARAVHDLVAGTVVVHRPDPRNPPFMSWI